MAEQVKILEAEFVLFRGFNQSRIKRLVATFTDLLQIINSTNSSGKSTFISQLNPFSIDKGLFKQGGFKRIIFLVDGVRYEVYSDHKTNRLVNLDTGENLNDGGTISQQTEVVKAVFGVTQYQWAICMGGLKFIDQPRNGRRKWMEETSGVNFDYVFGVFGKLTKSINGTKHSLKMLQSDLAAEAEKLVNPEEMGTLRATEAELKDAVRTLLSTQDPSVQNMKAEPIRREIEELSQRAEALYAAYHKLPRVHHEYDIREIQGLRDYLGELTTKLAVMNSEEERLLADLAKVSELSARFRDSAGVDYPRVEEELQAKTKQLEELREATRSAIRPEYLKLMRTPEMAKDVLEEVSALDGLGTFLFVDHDYSSDATTLPHGQTEQREYTDKLHYLKNQRYRLESDIGMMEREVKSIEDSPQVTCPECDHGFVPNHSRVDCLKADIATKETALKDVIADLNHVTVHVDSYNRVRDTIRFVTEHISDALRPCGGAGVFKATVSEALAGGMSLHDLVAMVKAVKTMALTMDTGFKMGEDIKRLQAILDRRDELKALGVDADIDCAVESVTEELGAHRLKMEELKGEIAKVKDLGKLASRHSTLLEDFAKVLDKLSNRRSTYSKVLDNVAMGLIVDDLQDKLAAITSRINTNQSVMALVDKLETMIRDQNERLDLMSLLHKAMNPKDGIIAEQLIGYCNAFAKQVTQILSNIWSFDIKVLPCSLEGSGGLDYKFPILLADEEPVPDIADGSRSQRCIINLAVLFSTRLSLGLNHLPLFLDEIAEGLDEVHTTRLREFVRQLTEDPIYGNIILVDHDIATRNLLGEYEEIVFDATQVVTESDYNRHILIEYY